MTGVVCSGAAIEVWGGGLVAACLGAVTAGQWTEAAQRPLAVWSPAGVRVSGVSLAGVFPGP